MIDLERWSEIKAIVQEALDLPSEERNAFLEEACGNDATLRSEVEALLAVSETSATFFDNFHIVPSSLQRPSLAEDDLVGSFRIIRPLDEGGMGMVHLAHDMRNDRQVALKTVPRRSESVLTREQQFLAKLHHANIATLFESGRTADGFVFFAMEYVEGEPITTYCNERKLTVTERLKLFLVVCDAVSFAHRNLVVHRDLKPRNILVTPEGQPKLLDFGIAKLLPPDSSFTTLTQPEDRSLTVAFASPEQLEGEHTTTATDVYSLGVLLCLLLTDTLPYPVKSYQDLPWAIRNMEPEKPSQLVLKTELISGEGPAAPLFDPKKLSRSLRGDLDAIVLRALRKEPEKRYQTVAMLAADIEDFLNDRPVSALRGTSRYRAEKFIRRHRVGAAVFLAILLASLGIAALFIEQYRETVRQRDEARHQTRRAQAVSDFLTGIFERSDPWKNAPETVTARQLLDRAAQDMEHDQRLDPLSRAAFLDTLGDSYLNLGLWDRADMLYGTALALRRKAAGAHDSAVGKSLHNLGLVAARKGQYKEAKRLYREALAIQRPTLGPQHRDIALTLHDLGITLRHLSEYQDAEATTREALQMRRTVVGTDDSVTVSCLSTLATIRENLGDLPAAENLYRTALPIARRVLGADHLVVANILGDLALLLEDQHNLDEADALAREALAIRRKRLGDDHPDIAYSLDMLARVAVQRGQNTVARQLSEEVLAMRIRLLGPSHPQVANSLTAVGVMAMKEGRFKDADQYFRQALAIHTAHFGLQHPHTATSMENLASALRREGNLPESERVYRQTLAIYKGLFGDDHPDTATCKWHLGLVLADEKHYPDAFTHLDEAIASLQKALAPDHPTVARVMKDKASILVGQQRFTEALPLAQHAYKILDSKLAPRDPARENMKVVMASVLAGLRRFEEAEKLLLEALGNLKGSQDTPPAAIGRAMQELASLYDAWGKPEKAAPYRQDEKSGT